MDHLQLQVILRYNYPSCVAIVKYRGAARPGNITLRSGYLVSPESVTTGHAFPAEPRSELYRLSYIKIIMRLIELD